MRPRNNARSDDNHYIVRDFILYSCGGGRTVSKGVWAGNYRGNPVVAFSLAKYGNPLLDWAIFTENGGGMVEVKTEEAYKSKNNGLEPYEDVILGILGNRGAVCVTTEDVEKFVKSLLHG